MQFDIRIWPHAVESLRTAIVAANKLLAGGDRFLLNRSQHTSDHILSCRICSDSMLASQACDTVDFVMGPVSDAAAESVVVHYYYDGTNRHRGIGPDGDKVLSAHYLDEVLDKLTDGDREALFRGLSSDSLRTDVRMLGWITAELPDLRR